MKSFEKRKEILSNIPNNTPYCYEIIDSSEPGKIITEPCKYYKHKKGLIGKCKLYNCEVEDEVKICGLKF